MHDWQRAGFDGRQYLDFLCSRCHEIQTIDFRAEPIPSPEGCTA